MTEHTPPPEQPMDDATRARIRARLTEETAREGGPAVGWLIPVGAAAAVLLIAITAAYAAFWPSGDGGAPAPAGGPSVESTTPTPDEPVLPSPSLRASKPPTASPSIPPPADDATLPPGALGSRCGQLAERQLPGAEQVVSWKLPGGPAGIWVAGDRSVFCEHSGGVSTIHRARPTEPDRLGPEQLGFSTTFYLRTADEPVTSFVAGGPLPEEVTGIDYVFPDGHSQSAVIRSGDDGRRWWSMAYVTDGRLADPGVNHLELDPVQVTVSRSGGREEHTLSWGEHDCAQVNHGC